MATQLFLSLSLNLKFLKRGKILHILIMISKCVFSFSEMLGFTHQQISSQLQMSYCRTT